MGLPELRLLRKETLGRVGGWPIFWDIRVILTKDFASFSMCMNFSIVKLRNWIVENTCWIALFFPMAPLVRLFFNSFCCTGIALVMIVMFLLLSEWERGCYRRYVASCGTQFKSCRGSASCLSECYWSSGGMFMLNQCSKNPCVRTYIFLIPDTKGL